MFIGKWIFRFHDGDPARHLLRRARPRRRRSALVCDQAKSQVPALGYTVTYAVGNTLLDDLGHGPSSAVCLMLEGGIDGPS